MLESPLTRRVPTPLSQLSAGFLENLPRPAFMTMPCDVPEGKAYDLSGSGNPAGTKNGGVTVQPGGRGVLGQEWKLDGVSTTHIDFGTSVTNVGTGDFTVAILCRLDASVDNAGAIGCFNGSGGFFLDSRSPSSTILPEFYCGGTAGVGTTNLRDGEYHLLVGTRLAGACTLYCDGVPQATFTGSAGLGTGTLRIGNRGDLASNNWNGPVAFMTFVRSGVAAAQVSSLYQSLLTGEPYALFEPTILDRWGGLSAAGGSFNPAWASRASEMLCGGMAA